jgi:hypothetical protein
MPAPLFDNIQRALVFLRWEELPRKEQPPKSIWLDNVALTAHFDRVNREREREMKGEGAGDGDMVENEAARKLLVG